MVLASCSRCSKKTDAELAAEERKKADEIWKASFALLPWRAIKGAMRSKNAPNRPAIYTKVDATLAVLQKPADPNDLSVEKAKTAACVDLLTYLVLHRSDLEKYDEDDFPRLANVLEETKPPLPAPWYDNPAEHGAVGLAIILLDAADKGDRVPARDIVFYELSRAPAQPGWPPPMRIATLYARGVTYLQHAFHYAAEEELTKTIEDVKTTSKADFAIVADTFTATKGLDKDQTARETFLAVAYLTRAYNRSKLERDDPATEDLALALESLDRLGIENELTWWAHAIVWQKRGEYQKSAHALDKLSESEYLEPEVKADLKAVAAEMRKNDKKRTWFHQRRTQVAIFRAVLARLGGVEGVVGFFVGKDKAHKWIGPFTSMSAAREALRDVAASQKDRFGGLAGGAAEEGKKKIGDLKKLVEAGAP